MSQATLASLVAELREALGQRPRDQVIRTVHAFGYAFTAAAGDVEAPRLVRMWIGWSFHGRDQALEDGEHMIGRDEDVALTLNSPTVSRPHVKIVIAGHVATLYHLGSKNGTYVRGQRVSSRAELVDGDRIRIGAFEITLRDAGPRIGDRARWNAV